MNDLISIATSDEAARTALQKIIKKEGFSQFCLISVVPGAAKACILRIQRGAEEPVAFSGPVRAGSVLSEIRKLIDGHKAGTEKLVFGDCILDGINHELSHGASVIRLTEKESHILRLLAQANGAVVTRKELLDRVWQYADGIETHTLETHIYRLRQKIERNPAKPVMLLTDESGYRLAQN